MPWAWAACGSLGRAHRVARPLQRGRTPIHYTRSKNPPSARANRTKYAMLVGARSMKAGWSRWQPTSRILRSNSTSGFSKSRTAVAAGAECMGSNSAFMWSNHACPELCAARSWWVACAMEGWLTGAQVCKRREPRHGRALAPLQDGALIAQLFLNLACVRISYLVQCAQLAAGRCTRGRAGVHRDPLTVTRAGDSFVREAALSSSSSSHGSGLRRWTGLAEMPRIDTQQPSQRRPWKLLHLSRRYA